MRSSWEARAVSVMALPFQGTSVRKGLVLCCMRPSIENVAKAIPVYGYLDIWTYGPLEPWASGLPTPRIGHHIGVLNLEANRPQPLHDHVPLGTPGFR